MDLTWLCFVAWFLIMIPVIYYGITSRMNYAKRLLAKRSKSTSRSSHPINMKSKTRFTKLDEFYKAVSVLIERLQKDGHIDEARKLNIAMLTGSTTGSELLGEIMLALKGMRGDYSPEVTREINECFEFALNHRKILGLDGGK